MKWKYINLILSCFCCILLLYSCFLGTAKAAGTNPFEDPSTYDDDIFKKFQEGAQNAAYNGDNSLATADPTKMMENARNHGTVTRKSDNSNSYDITDEGACCISAEDHKKTKYINMGCIIDINGDGSVTITTNEGSFTTQQYQNPEGVLIAYQVAYYAKQSLANHEKYSYSKDLESGDTAPWKTLLQYWSFGRYADTFTEMGLPEELFSHNFNIGIGTNLEDKRNEALDYAQKVLDGTPGYNLSGRMIIMEGVGADGQSTGQNDMIFVGSDEPSEEQPEIQIIKYNSTDSSEVISGAKFKIYKNGKCIHTAVTSGGNILYQGNKLRIGDVITIKEVSVPEGYLKSSASSQTITLKGGSNVVTFSNIKEEEVVGIKLIKKDKINEQPVPGAKFRIYRMKPVRDNSGIFKVSNQKYVKLEEDEYPQSANKSDFTLYTDPETGIEYFYYRSDGEWDYYANVTYLSAMSDRSQWVNQDTTPYTFLNTDERQSLPYVDTRAKGGVIKCHDYIDIENQPAMVPGQVPVYDENNNPVLDNNGVPQTTEGEVPGTRPVPVPKYGRDGSGYQTGEVIQIPESIAGKNWWKMHYVKEFYSQSSGAFIKAEEPDASMDCVTDDNGQIVITNQDSDGMEKDRKYFAYEVFAPEPYELYLGGAEFGIGTVTEEQPMVEQVVYEPYQTGGLKLTKKDDDDEAHLLEGVGFRFYHENYGWLVSPGTEPGCFDDSEDGGTIFKTNASGEISLSGLPIGNWMWVEDKESLASAHYGFITILEGEGSFGIAKDSVTPIEVTNKRHLIRLSGVVWVDGDAGKNQLGDNLWDGGAVDTPLSGVTVQLIGTDITGNVIDSKTTTTGADGTFVFKDVKIPIMNGEDDRKWSGVDYTGCSYNLQFTYDGFTYENVAVGSGDNASKAYEGESRPELNNKFGNVVSGNHKDTAQASGATGSASIRYSLRAGGADVVETIGTDIMASTKKAGVQLHYDRANRKMPYEEREELKGNNLGVYIRAHADIALTQDLDLAKVGMKGYWHLYHHNKYLQQDPNALPDELFSEGVGVQFEDYRQPVYRADATYQNTEDNNQELKLILTYKVALRNQSSIITTRINSLVDYYDNRYQYIGVGKVLKEDGTLDELMEAEPREMSGSNQYSAIDITLNEGIELAPGETKYVYVQFLLDREAALNMLGDENDKLENVVEVTSYTSTQDGSLYATVDRDACLDNVVLGNYDRYEDDTREAPALTLVESTPRLVSGFIFEDKEIAARLAEGIRVGDGQFEEAVEKLISNLEIQLIEVTGTGSSQTLNIYKDETGTEFRQTTTDGTYSFQGFTPGVYTIKFIWGEKAENDVSKTIEVGGATETNIIPTNYKSTVVDKDRYEAATSNPYYYRNMTDEDRLKSFAIDNSATREKIDTELNSHASVNDGYNYSTHVTQRTMDSWTPNMNFAIEEPKDEGNVEEFTPDPDTGLTLLPWRVEGINLGIIRRPIQQIEMIKRVSNVKVIYSSTEVITNADFIYDDAGNLEITGQTDYIAYLGDHHDPRNSQIKIELDNEILQNSSIEVVYDYIFKNRSEKDYTTRDFYRHGIVGTDAQLVTLSPSNILDYLGEKSDIIAGSSINTTYQWHLVELADIENYVNEDVFKSDAVKNTNIYQTEVLKSTGVQPGKEAKIQMAIQRRLQSGEDANLLNQVEVVEITKPSIPGENPNLETTGSEIIEVQQIPEPIPVHPGNYIPTKNSATIETDDAMAETVIVIPSTGGNKNYVPYIAIGITALIGLAGGTYFIKKKIIG